MAKKLQLESMVMGGVLALVIVGGAVFFFLEESSHAQPKQQTKSNIKRYDEGSLHHVADDLIHYNQNTKFKTELEEVWGLAYDESVGLFVCGKGGIHLYTLEGGKLLDIETEDTVRYIGFNSKGELMACVGNQIKIYNKEGDMVNTLKTQLGALGMLS